jgi:hypothetical protein
LNLQVGAKKILYDINYGTGQLHPDKQWDGHEASQ